MKTKICVHELLPVHEALAKTKRNIYIYDQEVFKDAPVDQTEKCRHEVEFFRITGGDYTDDRSIQLEYQARGLEPIDVYSLCFIDDAELPFSDYATIWKNIYGRWCFAYCDCSGMSTGQRDLRIGEHHPGGSWNTRFWFAGVKV